MQEENRIAREVVDAALKLHRHFGPGVYESVYEPVLVYELNKRSLTTRQQTPVPLIYEGITFDIGFKTDVVVNDLVILELKSVEKLEPVHFKQLLTYLRLTGLRLGLLINFGENLLKDGIHRVVNDLASLLQSSRSARRQADPFHQHQSSLS
jgi:GxxExxY protein